MFSTRQLFALRTGAAGSVALVVYLGISYLVEGTPNPVGAAVFGWVFGLAFAGVYYYRERQERDSETV